MKIKLNNTDYANILLVFWIGCLFSINSSIVNDGLEVINFYYFFNYLRAYWPIIIFFVLLITFIVKPKKKINLFLLSYFIYAFWQIIALLICSKEYALDLSRIHIVTSLLTTLLIIYYINYFNQINLKKLLFISIFFIILICVFFYSKIFYDFLTNKLVDYLYWSPSLEAEASTLSQTNPRITGLSRMMVLILYFVFYFSIIKKKYFLFLLLIIVNFLIYGSQSRGAFVGVILLYLTYIFFFKEEKIRKFIIVIATLLLPIILYESTLKVKDYLNKKSEINISINKKNRFLDTRVNDADALSTGRRFLDSRVNEADALSTGRLTIWSRTLKIIDQDKNFIGIGPQADRILLKKEKLNINPAERHFWDNNVSNGILYSFLSGGVVSLAFFLLIYFLIFFEIYKSIFLKKIYLKKNPYINFSIMTLVFLSLRSFFENSYAVFGVDSLFVCISYSILYRFNNSKN
jgi:O-antigen ligase